MKRKRRAPIVAALALLACGRKPRGSPADQASAQAAAASAPDGAPPAAPFNATPVAAFADAGNLDSASPYEQAKVFRAQGQLWMGRLVLERKALSPEATKDETELLLRICQDQSDAPCVAECARKLGRRIKMPDGGLPPRAAPSAERDGTEPGEPDELARARALVARAQYEPARKLLEPKVLDGKASREEVRVLRVVCEKQGDRMCVALCEAKLK